MYITIIPHPHPSFFFIVVVATYPGEKKKKIAREVEDRADIEAFTQYPNKLQLR